MKKIAFLVLPVLLLVVACGTTDRLRGTNRPATAPAPESAVNQVFYTFPDIPLPKEMTIARDRTFVYETPMLKAGVIVLTGNTDPTSLETYFKVNMAKNGWRFINGYKYGDVIQNYAKEDRSANIRISRNTFNTNTTVEIWVGPLDRSAAAAARGETTGNR